MLTEREKLEAMREAIANDAYAISFQTFGQYRTALLKYLDSLAALAAPAQPLSQAVASPIAAQWLPIDTAPKDGTEVLIYDPHAHETEGGCCVCQCDPRIGEWFEATGEQYQRYEPSHWMPLPAPPKEEA